MGNIIGIDLGTTNSEVALIKDNQPYIISINDEDFMPSCVGVDDQDKLLVGRPAKNQMVLRPESTILSIKRLMGETTTILMGGRSFTPTEISALILKELKKCAEEFLGEDVDEAVITVPAYFDDHQRKATQNAGKLAGLEIKRIINEPTAAALAYGVNHQQNQTILVYDLGGGTFDVSLVVIEDEIVEVKASHGDTQLGGNDFDNLIIDHIAEDFLKKHEIDLRQDPRTRNRLWQAVEKAKIELSSQPYTAILEEFITKDKHLDLELSRSDYEIMIQPLISKTFDCINKCLHDAKLLPGDLDQIILVGGSSRTPLIRSQLEDIFKTTVHSEINPDLIVAMGAAIQSGIISGIKSGTILVDITPYSFGTSAHELELFTISEGKFVPIIKRNTPLPARKSEVFYTVADNQEVVDVEIYQGEEPIAENNIRVGNFLIENLSQEPQGNPIVLEIKLDLNGILEVTATEKVSGMSKTVRMSSVSSITADNFAESQKKLKQLDGANDPDAISLEATAATGETNEPHTTGQHKELLSRAKNLRQRAEKINDKLDDDDALEINTLLDTTKESIKSSDWKKLEQTCESLADILFYLED